jgi:glycosyltransferase involved in cell wall biosynthesis
MGEYGDKPKVSVVVPTLNEERVVASTLINVLEVVPEAEIIVVDGGSKDNTVAIAKKYAKVYTAQGNVSVGRNTGAKMSSGDVIIFLDADTKINRKFIEKALDAFADPEVVGAGGLIMPEGSSLLEETIFYFFNLLIMISFVAGRPSLAGTCVGYRRESFFRVGGFDENMAASEDFDLCKRVSREGKIKFLRGVVVRTSRRRLEKLGLGGTILDWLRVTVQYLLRKKSLAYQIFR